MDKKATKEDDEETPAQSASCERPGEEEEDKAKESHRGQEKELVDERVEAHLEFQQEESGEASEQKVRTPSEAVNISRDEASNDPVDEPDSV